MTFTLPGLGGSIPAGATHAFNERGHKMVVCVYTVPVKKKDTPSHSIGREGVSKLLTSTVYKKVVL